MVLQVVIDVVDHEFLFQDGEAHLAAPWRLDWKGSHLIVAKTIVRLSKVPRMSLQNNN